MPGRNAGFFETRRRFLTRQAALRGDARLPGAERMTDELENARSNMIMGGLEYENLCRISSLKFDLYSRMRIDAEHKIDAYRSMIMLTAPYVDFKFDEDEEAEEISEEEERKRFVETWKQLSADGIPGVK